VASAFWVTNIFISSFLFFSFLLGSRFSETFHNAIVDNLGVKNVADLVYVYQDEELMNEVSALCKRLEFLKFKQIKEFTKLLNTGKYHHILPSVSFFFFLFSTVDLLKKQKELEEWCENNKLNNVYDLLLKNNLNDLSSVIAASQAHSPQLDAVFSQLKPIPLKKLKQCIQELESGGTGATASKPTVTSTITKDEKGKRVNETAINTTISLSVDDTSFDG
jgi:hypothetical protein